MTSSRLEHLVEQAGAQALADALSGADHLHGVLTQLSDDWKAGKITDSKLLDLLVDIAPDIRSEGARVAYRLQQIGELLESAARQYRAEPSLLHERRKVGGPLKTEEPA